MVKIKLNFQGETIYLLTDTIFIAPAYSTERFPSIRPSTFASKVGFLYISDSCACETLHSNCP